MKFISSIVLIAVVGLAGPLCWSKAPDAVTVENVQTISATVVSIDVDKRLVELKGPKGEIETIEVPAEVRNFAQVKVGDKVVVRYAESIGAVMKAKGTSPTLNSADITAGAARAAPGTKPGAGLGDTVTATVVIQSVDTKKNSVSFTGPGGHVRHIQVKDPKAQKFIATLKKDDQVELTFTEALAISVEPAK